MSDKPDKQNEIQNEIIAFLKSRGFIFPSSEIYGGLAGIYDYGHYGYLLMQNIKSAWMRSMIQERDDVLALDSAIFMHPKTWQASGHVDNFNDPQIDCRKCQNRMRADHLEKLICTNCQSTDLTEARDFNLMVKSNLGSPTESLSEENVIYLRPETCGGIYLEYKNTLDSLHPKLPFGIAQIGKAFRNEITTKQFIFRTREFEQMEMQFFINPGTTVDHFQEWKKYRWEFYLNYGLLEENLRFQDHEKLAHYAKEAVDIEYKYKMLGNSFKELEGVHNRGNWDLSQHQKFSGKDLTYFDEASGQRFIPNIIETSVGVARMMLAFIDQAYDTSTDRILLKLDKRLAPVKVAILPLSKKEELLKPSREIWQKLSKKYFCEYDISGSIGKRYRRQDEIGTPFCLTFDFESLNDQAVTIRDRDSMAQERIPISDLEKYLNDKLGV